MKRYHTPATLVLALAAIAGEATAGTVIDIPSTTVLLDGTHSPSPIDLPITVSGDPISGFTAVFTITPVGPSLNYTPSFAPYSTDPGQDPTLGSASYLFFGGKSFDQSISFNVASTPANDPAPTQLTASDGSADFTDVTPGATNNLLVLTQLVFPGSLTFPSSPNGVDMFTVSVSATFTNAAGDPNLSYTGSSTLTIEATPSGVPELDPGSAACALALLVVGVTILTGRRSFASPSV